MPIRIVEVPGDIQLTDPKTGEALKDEKHPERKTPDQSTCWTFADFLQHLLSHPQWVKSRDMIKKAVEIEDAFSGSRTEVELAEEDWDALMISIDEPKSITQRGTVEGFPWAPWVMRQLLPFLDAVADAEQKKRPKTVQAAKVELSEDAAAE